MEDFKEKLAQKYDADSVIEQVFKGIEEAKLRKIWQKLYNSDDFPVSGDAVLLALVKSIVECGASEEESKVKFFNASQPILQRGIVPLVNWFWEAKEGERDSKALEDQFVDVCVNLNMLWGMYNG